MVSKSEFIESGGRIKWEALIGTVIGGVAFAVWDGIIRFIDRSFDAVLSLLNGFAEFTVEVIRVRVGVLPRFVASSWEEASGLVDGAGPLGFAVGIGIVLVTFYVVAEIRGWF